jgi:3-hydroxyacyl-CoA dehydrogenase
MTISETVTSVTLEGDVAVITLDSPPVNTLSAKVRTGLFQSFRQVMDDPKAKAIVLICAGRTFISGADLAELGAVARGLKPPAGTPDLRSVQDLIEGSPKPVVAAIHGTALGGGFEVALCADYRVAVPSAKCGLPEVNVGLLPGAGGTQRLTRLVGARKALELIAFAKHVSASDCLKLGIVDEVVEEGRLREGAVTFAKRLIEQNAPLKKIRDFDGKVTNDRSNASVFDAFRKENARRFRGFDAPEKAIQCVEAAVNGNFEEGLALERKLFVELLKGDQSAAQRHAFFSERAATKIPDVPDDTPTRNVSHVGVLGAGTMGAGIAMNFANVGIPVLLYEVDREALTRGISNIRKNYEKTAARGGLKPEQVDERIALITGTLDMEDLAPVDLVIEAVFERMDVKKQVFVKLDQIVKSGAILASNTSYLDINEIASATSRPSDVVGLHFFSPANVMRLVEVVRGDATAKDVVGTCMKLVKKINKVGVLVGVCNGFVGNRMLGARQREAIKIVLEGAKPWDVDRVLYEFGFPMGPFAMHDLAGLDLGWVRGESKGESLRDVLCEMDRRGQKTGAGYYDYDAERKATPSPVTEKIISEFRAKAGITPRVIKDEEILERCIYSMVNEGAKILEEGKALRASDIDVVWLNGYGWPVYRGGPMHYGDRVGLQTVVSKLNELSKTQGEVFAPAALLQELASNGKSFAKHDAERLAA